ncbi:MAG: chromate transporter [Eubacteriales bacterium]|nr:chromate transporter [Eubacteriales bacterium]
MIYLQLFISMAKIGAMSIGGGYVALPLIQQEIVEYRGWLTKSGFADLLTISEITPGPIAVNASTFVGLQVSEILGAIIATLGCVLPSCIIIVILAKIYQKNHDLALFQEILAGLRPAVIGMIASAAVGLMLFAIFKDGMANFATQNINFFGLAIFVLAIIMLRKFKFSPIKTMMISGVIGVVVYGIAGL